MRTWLQVTCPMSAWPAAAADHDHMRSQVVAELFAAAAPWVPSASSATDAPPVLVQFWDTGVVPDDVQACLDSWGQFAENCGLSRVLFDDESALEFISDELSARHARAFEMCGHPAMRCDYFRLCYLERQGGVYVDADERYSGGLGRDLLVGASLKLQPLCYDIDQGGMIPAGQFLPELKSEDPSSSRIYYVNNNPMVAPPGHPLVAAALERATRRVEGETSGGQPRNGIQSTTGPGNLTAALVSHALMNGSAGADPAVALLGNWDDLSVSQWPLAYRADQRNWRLWGGEG